MAVRWYIGPWVPITLPGGRASNGPACFRYWSGGRPDRISSFRLASDLFLIRFDGRVPAHAQCAADSDLVQLPDRDETPDAAHRTRILDRLAQSGRIPALDGLTGRAVVRAIADTTGLIGPIVVGGEDVRGPDFGIRIR